MSQKVRPPKKIRFTEDYDSVIPTEDEVVIILNDFFSNALVNLSIPKFLNVDPLSESIGHHNLKAMKKTPKYQYLQKVSYNIFFNAI